MAASAWEKKTATLRRAKMDGYLGYKIAQYEGWAVANAKGDANPASAKEQAAVAEKANQFCADAKVKLTFPSISS